MVVVVVLLLFTETNAVPKACAVAFPMMPSELIKLLAKAEAKAAEYPPVLLAAA